MVDLVLAGQLVDRRRQGCSDEGVVGVRKRFHVRFDGVRWLDVR